MRIRIAIVAIICVTGAVSALMLVPAASSLVPKAQEEKTAMNYEISVREMETQHTLTIRSSVPISALSAELAVILPAVWKYMDSEGITPAGAPFTRYFAWNDDRVDFEAGFPVASKAPGKAKIKAGAIPGGLVATTLHVGPYDQLSAAHEAIDQWIAANGKEAAGELWEAYINDPGTVGPDEYQTMVYRAVK